MAMQTDTYANLLIRIQALAGVDAFATSELTLINSLINRRGYQAYRASDLWARFLKVGQARPGPLNVIPFSYTANDGNRTISSATRSGTTVTVNLSADIDGDFVSGQFLTMAGMSGTVEPDGSYQVTITDDNSFTYELDTTNTATETYTLSTATAQPDDIDDVDSFIRVFSARPGVTDSVGEYEFWVESDGCHVVNNSSGAAGFWVTYKKEWDGDYSTSNTAVPLEFFNYIAHAAYADFLRLNEQTAKAQLEESIAEQYLAIELDRPQNLGNANMVGKISTHTSRQSR
jgi:hypothetical protein